MIVIYSFEENNVLEMFDSFNFKNPKIKTIFTVFNIPIMFAINSERNYYFAYIIQDRTIIKNNTRAAVFEILISKTKPSILQSLLDGK